MEFNRKSDTPLSAEDESLADQWLFNPSSSSVPHPVFSGPDTDHDDDVPEGEYVPLTKMAKFLRPRENSFNEEAVRLISEHGSTHSTLLSSAVQHSLDSTGANIVAALQDEDYSSIYESDEGSADPTSTVRLTMPNGTNIQDDDSSSFYESDDGSADQVGATQVNDGLGPQSALLSPLGVSVLPAQLDATNIAAFARQSAQTRAAIGRTTSTVKHIHRSHDHSVAAIHTLKPDAAFRADPHGQIREHILALSAQWTETRDTILAAPFQEAWWDHESQLRDAAKAAHTTRLRRQVKADKSTWLLPRKLYVRAADWFAARKQRKVEERRRAAVWGGLNEQYIGQQLAQRRVVIEAQLSSAALEMHSGNGEDEKEWGRFLRNAYLRYLSEDAGRIFLPIRAEVDVALPMEGGGSGGGGALDCAPCWLGNGYQVIDSGNGEEGAFILRAFC